MMVQLCVYYCAWHGFLCVCVLVCLLLCTACVLVVVHVLVCACVNSKDIIFVPGHLNL